MKKIFTLIALLASTAAAMATDYTGKLVVNINGTGTVPVDATVSIDETSVGKCSLELKNFMLVAGKNEGETMPIGTISLTEVDVTTNGESEMLHTSQTITIAEGDLDGVDLWMGPMVGEVPLNLTAEIKDNKIYALINIDMPGIGAIEVTVGDVYQIPNSGFEMFHTATVYSPDGENSATSDEPDAWHSFMSASGNPAMVYLAGYSPHTFISNETRPDSPGSQSVMLTSVDMWFAIANGTITTGRINTGSMTAADPSNHSWLDLSKTDVDANGDPFHAILNGQPDSIAAWVKFKQNKPVADFPYATISAVITDGTYYQDPEDSTAENGNAANVVAKATNARIESNDFKWQKITIPFDYDTYKDNNATAKAILVTISTNASPGKGSTDTLYVDDIELIYNCEATAISVKGTPIADFGLAEDNVYEVIIDGESADITADDIEVTTNGKGARVSIEYAHVDCLGGGSDAIITVTSNDLKKSNTYYVKTRSAQYAGINNASVNAGGKTEIKAIYNMNGQMIKTPAKGSICVVKYTNGKTVKMIVK